MTIHFIGAGPGAPDLITLRGRDLIAASPICLYAGSLIPKAMLDWCPPGARIVDTAPLDLDAIVASVSKTGRCIVLHEATLTSGFGAELAALVQQHCFYHLEAPIMRVTGWDTPYPHAQEWAYFPGPARVGAALREIMESR